MGTGDGDHFRRLVEAAPDGIVISRNGIVLYVNPAASSLLGYGQAAELVGQPMTTFLDAAEGAKMRRRLEHMRETGEKLAPCEYAATRRDGSKIVAEITSMFTEYEGAPAVLAFARDVTERVHLRARLAHADRLAALGMLAAGVAHEINNPLAYMTLAAELLVRRFGGREGGEDVHSGARDILAGAGRIARIVRDLKAYARFDDEAPGPTDLATVVASAERIVAHEVRPRARLRVELGELPAVLGVSTRLEQVFVNLLLNAAYAIPDERGDGEIVIRGRVEGRAVQVDVSDNGAGIAEEALSRVFEPFFTTKPAGVGTGLGLSICRDIVAYFGGELSVTSALGRGTTMHLVLPNAKASASVAPKAAVPTAPVSRRSVLIIDDEPLIVSMVIEALGPTHDVVGETDPRAGLARILSGAPFDVVLCDLMMPEMTGMELYTRVAEGRPGFERRLVFATGGPYTTRAREFLETVPNACLMKPFSTFELLQEVARS